MKRRNMEEFFPKKYAYLVETPLQIELMSIRRTVDGRPTVDFEMVN